MAPLPRGLNCFSSDKAPARNSSASPSICPSACASALPSTGNVWLLRVHANERKRKHHTRCHTSLCHKCILLGRGASTCPCVPSPFWLTRLISIPFENPDIRSSWKSAWKTQQLPLLTRYPEQLQKWLGLVSCLEGVKNDISLQLNLNYCDQTNAKNTSGKKKCSPFHTSWQKWPFLVYSGAVVLNWQLIIISIQCMQPYSGQVSY